MNKEFQAIVKNLKRVDGGQPPNCSFRLVYDEMAQEVLVSVPHTPRGKELYRALLEEMARLERGRLMNQASVLDEFIEDEKQ